MSKLAKQGGNFGNVISGLFLSVGSSLPEVIYHLCTPPG